MLVLPIYTNVCNHCILGIFPSSVKKIPGILLGVGFKPTTVAILEQCLTN